MNATKVDTLAPFVCHGFDVEGIRIPAFQAGPGEIVKLCCPRGLSKYAEGMMAVCCDEEDGRIESMRGASTFELPMPRPRILEMFRRQTSAGWLIRNAPMDRCEAVERLKQAGIDPNMPLSMLAGNPRWMIGFLAAIHRRLPVLVFTTIGCDATGMQRGLAAVSEQLGNTAAVYLSCFNDLNIVEPQYAAVIEAVPIDEAKAA